MSDKFLFKFIAVLSLTCAQSDSSAYADLRGRVGLMCISISVDCCKCFTSLMHQDTQTYIDSKKDAVSHA